MSVIDDMFDDDPQIMYDIEKEISYEEIIKKLTARVTELESLNTELKLDANSLYNLLVWYNADKEGAQAKMFMESHRLLMARIEN